jgi:methylphosphotriester-DNA--protein-cysteine methyltransferase
VFGETLALDDLIAHRDVDDVLSRVGEAKDNAERVAAVEAFLLRRQLQRTPDAIVAHAARAIEMTHGSIRVGALARRLGITQNALERRFRERVGATPKQFASIVRLRHAVELQRSGATLTQVATEAGYFDQPHWNRQFRSAMGQAPQRFFTESEYC